MCAALEEAARGGTRGSVRSLRGERAEVVDGRAEQRVVQVEQPAQSEDRSGAPASERRPRGPGARARARRARGRRRRRGSGRRPHPPARASGATRRARRRPARRTTTPLGAVGLELEQVRGERASRPASAVSTRSAAWRKAASRAPGVDGHGIAPPPAFEQPAERDRRRLAGPELPDEPSARGRRRRPALASRTSAGGHRLGLRTSITTGGSWAAAACARRRPGRCRRGCAPGRA